MNDARSRPDVTVVIPTRNRWQFLPRTLQVLRDQEGVDLELVLVDDGSTEPPPDGLIAEVESLGRVVHLAEPRGMGPARNAGIDDARGRWVAFLDDDDIWSPQKLRRQLEAGATSDAVLVYCSAVVLNDHLETIEIVRAPKDSSETQKTMYLRNPFPSGASNVIVRADVLRQIGGFDDRLGRISDWDLWIRLSEVGRVAMCPDVLVGYILHARNQAVVADNRRLYEELEYMLSKHEAARLARGVELDLTGFSEWVAYGHRRAGRNWEAAKLYVVTGLRSRTPVNIARGVGSLMGERAWRIGRHLSGRARVPEEAPDWVAMYR